MRRRARRRGGCCALDEVLFVSSVHPIVAGLVQWRGGAASRIRVEHIRLEQPSSQHALYALS